MIGFIAYITAAVLLTVGAAAFECAGEALVKRERPTHLRVAGAAAIVLAVALIATVPA